MTEARSRLILGIENRGGARGRQPHHRPQQRTDPHRGGEHRPYRSGRDLLRAGRPDRDLALPLRSIREQAVLRWLAQPDGVLLGMPRRPDAAAAPAQDRLTVARNAAAAAARAFVAADPRLAGVLLHPTSLPGRYGI